MFWESVTNGLGILAYWQTYVAGLLFLALAMGPIFLFSVTAMISGRAESAIGCLSMLVLPFFQTFALVVFVWTMSPIILGLSQEAAWSLPWDLVAKVPLFVAKLVGMMVLSAIILAFIPILGRLQSLHTLLLGSVALIFAVGIIGAANHEFAANRVHFWPGFWFLVGLLVVGTGMAWLGTLLAVLPLYVIKDKEGGIWQLLALPASATFGFIPLFIYGAWLGAQIRAG